MPFGLLKLTSLALLPPHWGVLLLYHLLQLPALPAPVGAASGLAVSILMFIGSFLLNDGATSAGSCGCCRSCCGHVRDIGSSSTFGATPCPVCGCSFFGGVICVRPLSNFHIISRPSRCSRPSCLGAATFGALVDVENF